MVLAQRLNMRGIRYKDVRRARHLQQMLSAEGLDSRGERPLLEWRLANSAVPERIDGGTNSGPNRACRPEDGPDGPRRGGPGPGAGGAACVCGSAGATPTQWKEKLVKVWRANGNKLTKEHCAFLLDKWGMLEEDQAVYHIISPAAGGPDHPANYCVLPNYVPSDYHLEGKVELHHMLMREFLGGRAIERALLAGLEEEPGARKDAEARMQELKDNIAMFRRNTKTCAKDLPAAGGRGTAAARAAAAAGSAAPQAPAGPGPNDSAAAAAGTPSGDAAPATAAAASGPDTSAAGTSAAAQAGPSAAAPAAAETGPSTSDSPAAKRPRVDGEGPSAAAATPASAAAEAATAAGAAATLAGAARMPGFLRFNLFGACRLS